MIITNELAESMDKQTLSELATMYSTAFAAALGHKSIVSINPHELIYDAEEAEKFFLAPPENKNTQAPGIIELIEYKDTQQNIAKKRGFIKDGVAFIPLAELPSNDLQMMHEIALIGEIAHCSKLKKNIHPNKNPRKFKEANISSSKYELQAYASLNSFGSELGHLVGSKIYGSRINISLGEALDYASVLFEKSADIAYLCSMLNISHNLPFIKRNVLGREISSMLHRLLTYETLLFNGETAAKDRIIKVYGYSNESAENHLNDIIKDYITTNHYEGLKIFCEAHKSSGMDLSKTYKKLGNVLSHPRVSNFSSALKKMGSRFADEFNYDEELENNTHLRAEMLEKDLEKILLSDMPKSAITR